MNYEEHPSSIQRLISLVPSRPISLNFQMLKINKEDNDLIFNRLIQNSKIFENFEFKDIESKLKFLENLVKENSNRAKSLSFNVTGKNLDNIKTYCEISDKNYYISPLQLNYFLNPNALKLKANFQIFNNRFSLNPNTIAKEDQISLGIQLSHIAQSALKIKKSFYISNLLFLYYKYEFEAKFKVSDQNLDLRRSKQNNSIKFLLSRNFNERPFLFRENLNYDHVNKINFQYAHKFVTNRVDERNSSTEFLAKLPREDVEKHFKLFYLLNKANLKERSVTFFKASTSLIFSLNSTYIKNKLFMRKFLIFDPLTIQSNFELGNIVNLKDDVKNLKVHERFFINNFRGIENPSYGIKSKDGKKKSLITYLIYLYINYIKLSLKIF
jgi:hypothetical protein